jgi:acetyltransferase-like isoleucine patch superfamily enzyme
VRGAQVTLDRDVRLVVAGTLTIGSGTYLGRNCHVVAFDRVTVGAGCMLGERVSIHDEDHADRAGNYDVSPVVIGDGVWVGANAVILRGSRIGDGAVVAAGAVVRGDVAAGARVGGVPARPLPVREPVR